MFGSNRLGAALNVTGVTSLLSTYASGLSSKALVPGTLVPEDVAVSETINFYMTSPYDPRKGYHEYTYTVSCRSKLEHTSRAIADAVITAVNELQITSGTFYVSEVLQTLPPIDSTDLYNTPLTVILKSR